MEKSCASDRKVELEILTGFGSLGERGIKFMRNSKKNYNREIRKFPPLTLYKYVIGERVDIIQNQKIRFTQPDSLNDPFEVRPVFSGWGSKKELKSLIKENVSLSTTEEMSKIPQLENFPWLKDWMFQTINEKVGFIESDFFEMLNAFMPVIGESFAKASSKISILSLTEDRNNLLMWSHYAAQHTGIVIGFKSDHHFINHKLHDNDELRHPRPVSYSKSRPKINFSEKYMQLDDIFSQFFLTKSREWNYEKEWRVIEASSSASENFNLNNGETVYLFDAPHDAICEVIIGARASDHTKIVIPVMLRLNPSLHHVKLYKARLNPEEFGLSFAEIRFLEGPEQTAIDLLHDPQQDSCNAAMKRYVAAFEEKTGMPFKSIDHSA